MVRLVIFDMDDVLYAYDRHVRVDHLAAATGLSADHVRHALWGDDFEDRAEAGEWPVGEAYLEESNRRLGKRISRAVWVAARRASMTPEEEVIALSLRLKSHLQLGLLTNNASLLREELPTIAPEIAKIFAPRLHASCDFGARKPDPEVFRRYLSQYGFEPDQAVFIDDDPDNVAGAAVAGLAGHRFVDAARLRAFLEERSLFEG